MDDGNTLLAGGDSHRIMEIAPGGNVVWQLEQNELPGFAIGFVTGLQRLPNGGTLFSNWRSWRNHRHLADRSIAEIESGLDHLAGHPQPNFECECD